MINYKIMNIEPNDPVISIIASIGEPTQVVEQISNPEINPPISKMQFKLICVSKCKAFALEFAEANRAQKFTRVSEEFLISCEAALKSHIQSRIKSHPSKGKTLN